MIPMKRVLKKYSLVLDTKTDKSHLIKIGDSSQTPLLTFDSSLYCFDANNNQIARIALIDNHWHIKSDFDFNITPVNFEEPNSTFIIEADFCEKWLILNELKN